MILNFFLREYKWTHTLQKDGIDRFSYIAWPVCFLVNGEYRQARFYLDS